jgi:hypothetical protein
MLILDATMLRAMPQFVSSTLIVAVFIGIVFVRAKPPTCVSPNKTQLILVEAEQRPQTKCGPVIDYIHAFSNVWATGDLEMAKVGAYSTRRKGKKQ